MRCTSRIQAIVQQETRRTAGGFGFRAEKTVSLEGAVKQFEAGNLGLIKENMTPKTTVASKDRTNRILEAVRVLVLAYLGE